MPPEPVDAKMQEGGDAGPPGAPGTPGVKRLLPTTLNDGGLKDQQDEAAATRAAASKAVADAASTASETRRDSIPAMEEATAGNRGTEAPNTTGVGASYTTPTEDENGDGRCYSRRPTLTLAELPRRVIECQVVYIHPKSQTLSLISARTLHISTLQCCLVLRPHLLLHVSLDQGFRV